MFHWQLNPMFAAAAMSLSSFCVVINALRLNLFSMYDAGKDRPHRRQNGSREKSVCKDLEKMQYSKKETEEMKMEKTMKIEGMMCEHCEARVKKCLEALPQVDSAKVSHKEGTAVLSLNAEIDNETLKKTMEDQDYKVTFIQ